MTRPYHGPGADRSGSDMEHDAEQNHTDSEYQQFETRACRLSSAFRDVDTDDESERSADQ